jgi:hypothetical protein
MKKLPEAITEMITLLRSTPVLAGITQLNEAFGDDPHLIADFISLHRRVNAIKQARAAAAGVDHLSEAIIRDGGEAQ